MRSVLLDQKLFLAVRQLPDEHTYSLLTFSQQARTRQLTQALLLLSNVQWLPQV